MTPDTKKKTVVFKGPVLTQSGYGQHSRQVSKWLLQRNDIDVKFLATPWGNTPWLINHDASAGLIGQIMQRTVGPENAASDVSIQLLLPDEWDPKLSNYNVGVTAAVETDRCHPSWIPACNAMDKVIVPSQHAKLSLTNTGEVIKPLLVVPESYSEAIDDVEQSTMRSSEICEFSTDFNFLIFGQLTGNNPDNDRKNIFYTVKWLCEAFKDDKDVGIVVKTNAGKNTKIDKRIVTDLMRQLLVEVRKGPYPRFHLLHGDMSDREVAMLYRHKQVKALVSLTRGEGYGLPILEAAASGLPVIATGWSGHMDFLKHGKFISVYYQLDNIHPSRVDNKIFVKGARWANASEQDFKKRAAKFRENSSTPQEWALAMKKNIRELYSFKKICQAYDEAFNGVL